MPTSIFYFLFFYSFLPFNGGPRSAPILLDDDKSEVRVSHLARGFDPARNKLTILKTEDGFVFRIPLMTFGG